MNIIAGILLIVLLGGPVGITLGVIWILVGLFTLPTYLVGLAAVKALGVTD